MDITPARKWALTQIVYRDVLHELDVHFRTLSVIYMPIKGAYLICSGLAERMKERFISDIDILVHHKDLVRVSDYFTQLDETELKVHCHDNYRNTETVFHYFHGGAEICVEIHSLLNVPQRFLLPTEALFARSRVADGMMHFPSPEDALLIFLCHLQSHFPFEFRDETFDEISVLTSADGFNWHTFWQHCPATGMEAFIYFMLKVYHRKNPIPQKPSQKYVYADWLAAQFSRERYARMPRWLRRLVFDVPFVRKPVWLISHKIFHPVKK